MKSTVRALLLLAVPAFVVACSDLDPTEPGTRLGSPSESAAALDAGFPLYGIGGLAQATAGQPCSTEPYREFDFWLGKWDVFDPDGNQVGTNIVTSELDGCVVAEHWVSAGGSAGRSINTFDAETGQWHQTWASANFRGHLRMAGGLHPDGRMVLAGQRDFVSQGITLFDEYVWTPLGPDRVRQVGTLSVPAAGFEGTFVGIYERRDEISPASLVPSTECQAGGPAEQARQLDFWIGDWVVSTASGKVLGTSAVSTDLSGCLLEERFRTPRGYEAVAFATFDWWEQRWYRTYIDNRGEQVRLSGGLEGNTMTLAGEEGTPGKSRTVLQRVTIVPTTEGDVRQSIEVSRDGGESWTPAVDLVYRPAGSME